LGSGCVLMSVKNNKKRKINSENALNGYLVCHSCHGYYELKDNESPDDFTGCECGSPLIYTENIDNILKSPVTFNKNEEYEELDDIVNYLKTEARERKEVLKSLSERITIQEQALNNINKENLIDSKSIWDLLEEKDIENEINKQKKLIENSISQEDAFLSRIQEKRSKSNLSLYTEKIRIPSILVIGLIIILLVSIIALYAV